MDGGMLMGARFDAAIDADTDYKIGTIALPTLSANDPDMPGTELRSYLVVTGDDDTGKGMFSMTDLLGGGMANDEGANFVGEAVKSIEKVRADVAALLALDTKPTGLEGILDGQWEKLHLALDNIFGTNSAAETDATFAVRESAPREEDILDDILDALASEASFVAATAEDGGGVFESQALGAGAAADAFNRVTWSADATMGMTGSTRYGTMSLTISGLASAAGDPLTNGGSTADGSEAPGTEIADIVLGGFSIVVGATGDNANDLIVGTAGTPDTDTGNVAYTEIAPTSARLRFSNLGTGDVTDVPAIALPDTTTDGASVKALFVGQGVDGPLGVIGTWAVHADSIGLLNAAGTEPTNLSVPIYGAFGAESP